MTNPMQAEFIRILDIISHECFRNSADHGFWEQGDARNKPEMIALMHSELSEALEGLRKPGPDAHCPEFTSVEIELADTFIRLVDFAAGFKLRLGAAILAKMAFNASRPHKHGKAF